VLPVNTTPAVQTVLPPSPAAATVALLRGASTEDKPATSSFTARWMQRTPTVGVDGALLRADAEDSSDDDPGF